MAGYELWPPPGQQALPGRYAGGDAFVFYMAVPGYFDPGICGANLTVSLSSSIKGWGSSRSPANW